MAPVNLRNYLGAIDDYLGDDEEYLGAVRRPMKRPLAVAAKRQLQQPMPGVPTAGPRIEPLGFPTTFAFVNAGATTISQNARPMKPFKGSRVIIDIARTGATATGLVTVTALVVGARPVPVAQNPIGAGVFAPNAFGIELMMDEAVPGIDITCALTISAAPGAGDSVICSVTIIGLSWS
jgi:hypothetical protein